MSELHLSIPFVVQQTWMEHPLGASSGLGETRGLEELPSGGEGRQADAESPRCTVSTLRDGQRRECGGQRPAPGKPFPGGWEMEQSQRRRQGKVVRELAGESQGGKIKPTPDICRAWEMQMIPGSQPAPPPFFSHFLLVLQSEGLLLMECMHIPTINPSSFRALHLQTAAHNCPSGPGHRYPSCFPLKRTNQGRKPLQALEVGLELFGQRCPNIGYLERGLEDKSRAPGVGGGHALWPHELLILSKTLVVWV